MFFFWILMEQNETIDPASTKLIYLICGKGYYLVVFLARTPWVNITESSRVQF